MKRKPRSARGGWLLHCKPSDSFVVASSPDKISQDERNAITDCKRAGVFVTSERIAILRGPFSAPSIQCAVILTVVSTGNYPEETQA